MTSDSILVVGSSFYTPALEAPFATALAKSGWGGTLVCVPYNQLNVFLLNPASVIPKGASARVLLLLRVEDLIRLDLAARNNNSDVESACLEVLSQREAELVDILTHAGPLRFTAMICPAGKGAFDVTLLSKAIRIAEHKIMAKIRTQQKHLVVTWAEFEGAAKPGPWFNAAGDRLGHVPFTPEGLEAIATFFVDRLQKMPVLLPDADGSLPGGAEFSRFLASLNVEIEMTPLSPQAEQLAIDRMRHTTHFITQPDVKWQAECLRLLASGTPDGEAWTLAVKDRYGCFGISGAAVWGFKANQMNVKSLFLTCPVLGKQVEYALFQWMAQIAEQRRADLIHIPVVHGRDNKVLTRLLSQLAVDSVSPDISDHALGTTSDFYLQVAGLSRRVAKAAPNPDALSRMVSRMSISGVACA